MQWWGPRSSDSGIERRPRDCRPRPSRRRLALDATGITRTPERVRGPGRGCGEGLASGRHAEKVLPGRSSPLLYRTRILGASDWATLRPTCRRSTTTSGIGAGQRHERRDVVALERIQVASQQGSLLGVHRGRVGALAADGLERDAGALNGAVDRGDAGVEERGPLSWRQELQGGHEGDADRLTRVGQLRRFALVRADPTTRARPEPTWVPPVPCGAPPALDDCSGSNGRALRSDCRRMSMLALVAMRYSHDRRLERPSKLSMRQQARTIVSCTASSASNPEPRIRRQ